MTGQPRLLALDTAADVCAVGIHRADRTLAARCEDMTHGHAESLAPMIADCLREAGMAGLADLQGIAVTRGPGTFTGLRIGLAAARGLGLATGLPVVGVTSFEAVAARAMT